MYEWVKSVPKWAQNATACKQQAHMIYKGLWSVAGLAMLGGLIFFSSNPPEWLSRVVAYGAAALGALQFLVTGFFVSLYSRELQRLSMSIGMAQGRIINISEEEVRSFLRQGPSPLRMFLSSAFIMIALFLPALNYRFLGKPIPW